MAEEISKRLGTYTTRTESQQHPYVNFWSLSTATNIGNTSQGESLTSRPLLTPDEIMRWPMDRSLVLQQRKAPANLPLPDLSVWQKAGLFVEFRRGEPEPIPDGGPEAAIWWPLQEVGEPPIGEKGRREVDESMSDISAIDMSFEPGEGDDDITMDDLSMVLMIEGQDVEVIQ